MEDKRLKRVFDQVKLSREREEAMLADLLNEKKEVSGMKQTKSRRRIPAAALVAAVLVAVLAGSAIAVGHFGQVDVVPREQDIHGNAGSSYNVYGNYDRIQAESLSEEVWAYGKDSGESFADAVEAASRPLGILRVRLGSLEPDHMTDEVIDALSKLPKLCGQFHISLQSGCDRTLKQMNRHYTAAEYLTLAKKLRAAFPDCTLTTDMMVGFAGETDADFQESVQFAETVGFEKIHVFPYSVRQGTRAADFDGQVEKSVKEARAAVLLDTAKRLRTAFLKRQIGKTVEVLCEHKTENGQHFGYTANYTPVLFTAEHCRAGDLVRVKITETDGENAVGKIL